VDLSPGGRIVLAALGLLAAGFAMGSLVGVSLSNDHALAILSGAAILVTLAARRPRRG